MKKFGLLALTLVTVMAVLGVGYAMWFDTVTLNATVGTGTVTLGILDVGSNDAVVGTTVSPDPNYAPGNNAELKDVASLTSTNGTVIGTTGYYESITEAFDNVYPWYAPTTSINIKNLGSIPVKINNVSGYFRTGTDLISWMSFIITIDGHTIGPFSDLTTLSAALVQASQDTQIEPGETVPFTLQVIFNETNAQGQLMPQDASATYEIIISAAQWNEVT